MIGVKATYIDQLFYIVTIYLAKLAALQFLIILARPNEPNLRRAAVKGTLAFVILWLVIAVVCIAFQCKVPTPWNEASGQCFDQVRTAFTPETATSQGKLIGSSWPSGPPMLQSTFQVHS